MTQDRAIDPEGFEIKRAIIQHQGSAVMMAVDDKRRILLVRQYRLAGARLSCGNFRPAGWIRAKPCCKPPSGTARRNRITRDDVAKTRQLFRESRFSRGKDDNLPRNGAEVGRAAADGR